MTLLFAAEAVVLTQGRELIRQSLETIAQEEIDDSEKLFYRYSVEKRKCVRNAKRKNGIEDTETKTSTLPSET